MVYLRSWACLITFAALFLTEGPHPASAKSQNIEIVAQVFEPAQMYRQGKPAGFATELIQEISKRVHSRTNWVISKVGIHPWPLAYDKAISKPNMLMFSISRNARREDRFIWAGKIFSYEVHFYSLLKRDGARTSSLHQLVNSGHLFGVPDMGQVNDFVHEEGFVAGQNFVTYPHYSRGVRMLFDHHVDAIPMLSHNAKALVCREGFDGDQIHSLFRAEKLTKPLWMVFSKGTSDEVVLQFQKALKEVQDEKMDIRLQAQYISEFQNAACRRSRTHIGMPMVSLLSVP